MGAIHPYQSRHRKIIIIPFLISGECQQYRLLFKGFQRHFWYLTRYSEQMFLFTFTPCKLLCNFCWIENKNCTTFNFLKAMVWKQTSLRDDQDVTVVAFINKLTTNYHIKTNSFTRRGVLKRLRAVKMEFSDSPGPIF